MEELLNKLNDNQREAVEYLEGPVLVLAGAGSGKTRVLTNKIAYLVMSGVIKPYEILAITFTNKAAREMKDRVGSLLGTQAADVWLGTFHSICIRMLKKDIEVLGFSRYFSIFDEDDKNKLIKKIVKNLNLDDKQYKHAGYDISNAKNDMLEPAKYAALNKMDYYKSNIARIYEEYQRELKRNDALDFDDIINYTVKILEEYPEKLKYYENKFKYILVDEYQDTNKSQYKLITLLSKSKGNICVVGDESQSIYGWRGADIKNILSFNEDFNNAKIIKLEENYRSTKTILNAANEVIKNNESKIDKNLWTQNEEGSKITIHTANNEYDEARFVVKKIIEDTQKGKYKHSEYAVLYRTNVQSRALEEILIQEGVPYRLIGGLKFYARKEIKDIMAYLKLVNNQKDNISLARAINEPKRGIGETTVEKLEELAMAKNVSIFDILLEDDIVGQFRCQGKLREFRDIILKLDKVKKEESVGRVLDEMLHLTHYVEQYKTPEKLKENENRIDNIKEFIGVAYEFEKENSDNKLSDFLETIALVADVDKLEEDEDTEKVTLMTLHNSKGLEYKNIFMVGLEEGLFPSARSIGEISELEEERRLCYVGITRAMENLYISSARQRMMYGSTSYTTKSRFLEEIPGNLVESNVKENIAYNKVSEAFRKLEENKISSVAKPSYGISVNSFLNNVKKADEVDLAVFKEGVQVEHKRFGTGTINKVEKEGTDLKLEIIFEHFGMKRMMAKFAGLKIL